MSLTKATRTGPGRLAALSALLLLTLTFTSAMARVDAAALTSASCTAATCANETVITFTGTDLADVTSILIGSTVVERNTFICTVDTASATSVACTLSLPSSAIAGIYPVNLVSTSSGTVPAGSVAIGTLASFSPSDYGFVNGWRNVQAAASESVTSFSNDWPSSGDAWTVFGNFDSASTYKVLFYSDEEMGMIACGDAAAITPSAVDTRGSSYTNALECTITSSVGVMGMFTLLVQNVATGAFLPGSTQLYKIAVNPPLPTVSRVDGACVTDSTACVSGATLTFTGTNFNTRGEMYNTIVVSTTDALASVTGASSTNSGITCTVTAVTSTSLECTLTVPSTASAGSYAVYTKVSVCTHMMVSPGAYVGNLMYGTYTGSAAASAGFTVGSTDMATGSQVVAAKTDGYIFTGGWLAVYGTFAKTHDFAVEFYNTQAAGTGVPTCTSLVVTAYMINCTGVAQALGNLGMYRVLVKDNTAGYYLPTVTTTATAIMVYAPLPTFTAASGDCAANSGKCVTGATLTFTGSNFVVGKKMAITFDQSGLQCTPGTVTSATSVTCTLTIDSSVPAGAYNMYVAVQGCAMGMMTPPHAAGQLILTTVSNTETDGSAAVTPGWKATSATTSDSSTGTKTKSTTNVAAVVCAVVFGILTLVFAVAFIIVICLYCRVRKPQQSFNEYGQNELMGMPGGRRDPFAEEKVV